MSPEDERAADDDALRHGVGIVPVRRDVVRVAGPDAVSFLQGQCSQDVEAMSVGDCADALLLTPQGKLDALVRVTRLGDQEMLLDVDAGWGPAVCARLERFKIRVKATVEALDWSCVALRGPRSSALVQSMGLPPGGPVVLPFAWGPVSGVDIMGSAPLPRPDARACGAEAWEAQRIEAGICAMGAELDDRTIAAEAGLLERSVSLTKGCYTGQELVARLDARGNKVARHLRGLVATGPADGVLVAGAPVTAEDGDGKVVGRVTSAAYSSARGAMVGLAYLQRAVEIPARVVVGEPGAGVVSADVSELPITS